MSLSETPVERKTAAWTFKFWGDRRGAYAKLVADLGRFGFSVGSRQRGAPSGVMFGEYSIAKWRNLNQQERDDLHGVIHADAEPVTLYFRAQPAEIDDAIFRFHAASCDTDPKGGDAKQAPCASIGSAVPRGDEADAQHGSNV